ncbi:MAG: ClpXP protease specificity-enhancing factor SspB [Gammaproteobacteria bacterium]|nr:ClpXP protease specificity-enhancing factor SspB [Gammaproteobacteria bacterium]
MRLRFPILKTTYEWLLDEGLTPYFLINAEYPNVIIPREFVEDGHIVLDGSVDAIDKMHFDESGISFREESEQGVFTTDHPTALLIQEGEDAVDPEPESKKSVSKPSSKPSRSHLKLVK